MGQPDIATQRDTAVGTHPPTFLPTGRGTEVQQSGATTLGSETLRWTKLAYQDKIFVFNRDLLIRVIQEDGGWAFDSDDPELSGFGHTRTEAEQSFCFDFSSCWRNFACEEDSKLAPDAMEMKRVLLGLVSTHSG